MFLKYTFVHVDLHFQVHPAQILPLFPTCGRQAIFTAGHRALLIIIINHHYHHDDHHYDHDNHCHHHRHPQERPLGSPTITASDQRARSHSGEAKVKTSFFCIDFFLFFLVLRPKPTIAISAAKGKRITDMCDQYLIVAGREGDSRD